MAVGGVWWGLGGGAGEWLCEAPGPAIVRQSPAAAWAVGPEI